MCPHGKLKKRRRIFLPFFTELDYSESFETNFKKKKILLVFAFDTSIVIFQKFKKKIAIFRCF